MGEKIKFNCWRGSSETETADENGSDGEWERANDWYCSRVVGDRQGALAGEIEEVRWDDWKREGCWTKIERWTRRSF